MVLTTGPAVAGPCVVTIDPRGGQVGLGVNARLIVRDVIGGLPAAAAGVRQKMRVMSVNGAPVETRDAYVLAMKNALRGQAPLRLGVEVPDDGEDLRSLVASDIRSTSWASPDSVPTAAAAAVTAVPPAAKKKRSKSRSRTPAVLGTVPDLPSPTWARRASLPTPSAVSSSKGSHPLLPSEGGVCQRRHKVDRRSTAPAAGTPIASLSDSSTPRCVGSSGTGTPPTPRHDHDSTEGVDFYAGDELCLLQSPQPQAKGGSPAVSPLLLRRRGDAAGTGNPPPLDLDIAQPHDAPAHRSPGGSRDKKKRAASLSRREPPAPVVLFPPPTSLPVQDGHAGGTRPRAKSFAADVLPKSPRKWGSRRARLTPMNSDCSESCDTTPPKDPHSSASASESPPDKPLADAGKAASKLSKFAQKLTAAYGASQCA